MKMRHLDKIFLATVFLLIQSCSQSPTSPVENNGNAELMARVQILEAEAEIRHKLQT